jgi:zona occludens toxin (predicted ATPase)
MSKKQKYTCSLISIACSFWSIFSHFDNINIYENQLSHHHFTQNVNVETSTISDLNQDFQEIAQLSYRSALWSTFNRNTVYFETSIFYSKEDKHRFYKQTVLSINHRKPERQLLLFYSSSHSVSLQTHSRVLYIFHSWHLTFDSINLTWRLVVIVSRIVS